jgi:hypothetical protein
MNRVSFWDILFAGIVIFSGINLFWGDKIPLFDFAGDPLVKMAMTAVSAFLISVFIGGMKKG